MAGMRLEGTEYEIVRELGSGGMGQALLARHLGLDRLCVLKFVHPEFAWTANCRARALREARGLGKIRHANVVEVYDYRELSDGRQCLVMEYIEGETLSAILQRKRLPIATCLRLIASALDGLQAVHDAGLVHRDIKPSNLMVLPDLRQVKLIDFGVNKGYPISAEEESTEHGVFIGTAQYTSPEQALRRPVTPASDIYSTAVVLYECLTGQPLFDARCPADVLQLRAQTYPPAMEPTATPEYLSELQNIFWQGLAIRPQDRFENAAAFAARLRALLRQVQDERHILDIPLAERASSPSLRPSAARYSLELTKSPPARSTRPSRIVAAQGSSLLPSVVFPETVPSMRRLEWALCAMGLGMVLGLALGAARVRSQGDPALVTDLVRGMSSATVDARATLATRAAAMSSVLSGRHQSAGKSTTSPSSATSTPSPQGAAHEEPPRNGASPRVLPIRPHR